MIHHRGSKIFHDQVSRHAGKTIHHVGSKIFHDKVSRHAGEIMDYDEERRHAGEMMHHDEERKVRYYTNLSLKSCSYLKNEECCNRRFPKPRLLRDFPWIRHFVFGYCQCQGTAVLR